jgi:hypothetical protein
MGASFLFSQSLVWATALPKGWRSNTECTQGDMGLATHFACV